MVQTTTPLSPEGRASFVKLYRDMMTIACIRTLSAAGVFDSIGTQHTLDEISAAVDVDKDILERLLRPLVAIDFVHYDGQYYNTPTSSQYVRDGAAAHLFNVVCKCGLDIFSSAANWLASSESYDLMTFHHRSNGREGKTKFDIMNQDPEIFRTLHRGLSAWQTFHPLLGSYDFDTTIMQYERTPSSVFLVDIGGGNGDFVEEFLRAHPSINASEAVIQDLPGVVELTRTNQGLPSTVQVQPYDFFQPQPIRGAMVYHIRACLHDWDDVSAVEILTNIAAAMHPTSTLLIGDNVMNDVPSADDFVVLTDILMLGVGGKERTKDNFADILDKAGLKMVQVHPSEEPGWCTIEARLR